MSDIKKRKFISFLFLLTSLIVCALLEFFYFKEGFVVDDSYISFRYAENFANGHGLVWNINDAKPIEGYSNFLWIIIESLAFKLHIDVLTFTSVLGGIFGLLTITLSYYLAKIITKDEIIAGIASLGVAIIPAFSAWAMSSMETTFYSFLFILSLILLIKERHNNNFPVLSSISFAFFALTRVEGVVVFIVIVLINLILNIKSKDIKIIIGNFFVQIVFFGIIYLPYYMWRYAFYGYPFSNTAYVKAGGIGIVHPLTFIAYLFPLIVIAILGMIYAKRYMRNDDYYLIVYIGVFWWVLSFIISPIVTMPIRFHIPILPILALFLAIAIVHTFRTKQVYTLIIVAIILNPITLTGMYGKFGNESTYLGDKELGIELFKGGLIGGSVGGSPVYTIGAIIEGHITKVVQYTFIPTGKWIYNETKGNATIAFGEAGALPYYSKATCIDLLGLNDEYIAHNGFNINYLLSKQPDYIILVSTNKTNFTGIYEPYTEIYNNHEFKDKYELIKINGILSKVKRSASWFLWIYKKK